MARAVALFLVAPFLTFASALTPQHVHETGHDHGHAVAHSHFGPHHVDLHDSDDLEIEHDIEHVVWLDSSILHEAPYRAASAPEAVPVGNDIVRVTARWSAARVDEAAPAHGPPRHTPLFRGPPPPLA